MTPRTKNVATTILVVAMISIVYAEDRCRDCALVIHFSRPGIEDSERQETPSIGLWSNTKLTRQIGVLHGSLDALGLLSRSLWKANDRDFLGTADRVTDVHFNRLSLCCFFVCLLPSTAKRGQIVLRNLPGQSDTRRSQLDRLIPVALILSALAGTAIGCSSGPAPLSIKMHNPKTDQSLTCAARDQRGDTDVSMLAGAVESCARSLEARGFVRQK